MKLNNPHLPAVDHFHHLGFDSNANNLLTLYQDVKFVCLMGSANRAKSFAKFINKELNINRDEEELLTSLCLTDRYVMYKVGSVLIANHGIGIPSLSIILNELFKVLHYANAQDVTFFRIGTSGGIGIKPGTVVLTKRAVNGCFEAKTTDIILGEVKEYNTEFLYSDFDEFVKVATEVHENKHYDFVFGDTMCCDNFYEGQGRMDGAFCKFSKEDQVNYLKRALEHGVSNIEMESLLFASMCNQAQVNAFVVCVTLLDRLEGDQISIPDEEFRDFQFRPFHVVLAYMRTKLSR